MYIKYFVELCQWLYPSNRQCTGSSYNYSFNAHSFFCNCLGHIVLYFAHTAWQVELHNYVQCCMIITLWNLYMKAESEAVVDINPVMLNYSWDWQCEQNWTVQGTNTEDSTIGEIMSLAKYIGDTSVGIMRPCIQCGPQNLSSEGMYPCSSWNSPLNNTFTPFTPKSYFRMVANH